MPLAARLILGGNGLIDIVAFLQRKVIVAKFFQSVSFREGGAAKGLLVDSIGATLGLHGLLRILCAMYIDTRLALPLATVSYFGETLPAFVAVVQGRLPFRDVAAMLFLPMIIIGACYTTLRKSFGPKGIEDKS